MQYQTLNPYSEELVQTFPLHTDGDIESIIVKAEKTYASDWSRRPLAARKAVIKKAASLLRDNADAYAKLSTLEMGKLFREGQSEVRLCAAILDYFADNAETFLAPETLAVGTGEAVIESAPLGVLLGDGIFTIPRTPVRRRLHALPRFVSVRGGEYCFMPGLRALQWIAALNS